MCWLRQYQQIRIYFVAFVRLSVVVFNPAMSSLSARALNDALAYVAGVPFGDPGWTDALVERHGFTPQRSARGRIDVTDLLPYPKLRTYLQGRYGVTPHEAWRSLPDAAAYTVQEKREAIRAYRRFVLMDVGHVFLEDVMRLRE
jgi:hypothetical protein